MHKSICLLLSLTLISCGHIYVSDIQIDFQNSGYVSSAQLYFKLENDLFAQEVLKLTWPYVFNQSTCSITCYITLPGSTANLTSTTAIVDSTNSQAFVIEMDSKLSGQQWYRLNVSTITPTQIVYQSPSVGYYEEQVQIESFSGHDSGKTTEYMLYDYNSACGFIAISPAPVEINSVVVGVSQNSTSVPSSSSENTYFETTYTIYITVQTKNDYEFGATYHFAMTGPFTWTGTCETITQDCTGADDDCISIYALVYNKDYICTYKDSLLSFVRYQNSSNLAVSKDEFLKFKVKVKNPNKISTAGLDVQVVSNYARYIYEYKKIIDLFETNVTAIFCGSAKYLWGLSKSTKTPCPVRTYLSKATEGFKLTLDVQAVNYINDMSIWTDCAAISSQSIQCTTDTANKLINCQHVGQLEVNITKYIKFAYVAYCTDHDATKFSKFGELTFYHMDDGSAITTTATPMDQTMDIKICNADYYTKNQIFDATISTPFDRYEYKQVNLLTSSPNSKHRESIHYSESPIDLLIQITTSLDQQCCKDVSSLYYDCYTTLAGVSYLNSACNTSVGANARAYHQVLKVVANNNIMSFDSTTELDSVDDETIFKGVEVLNDMFGMTTATNSNGDHGICMREYTDGGTFYTAICSSYSNYISYTDATSTTDLTTQYRFNQWHLRSTYLELHLTCYTALENTAICGAVANDEGSFYPKGILIKNAQLNITANPLYPSQSELDFLLCMRYTATAGSLVLSGTTVLASSQLINAQIIHTRSQIGYTTNTTYFRIGYLNVYQTSPSTDVYSYVPTLLRIGGFIHEDDISVNKGIVFFFDQGLTVSETQLSATMPLDPTECASPFVSTPLCKYFSQKTITTPGIIGALHEDYYPSLNGIVIGGNSVNAGEEFNYYVPIKITGAVQYGFLALLSDYSVNLTASAVFKLFGSTEIYPVDSYQKITQGSSTFLTPAVTWSGTTTDTDILNNNADWEVGYGTTNGYGTVNIPSAGFTKGTTGMALQTAADIYPEGNETDIIVDASSAGWADPLNDDQTASLNQLNLQFRACAHFTMHSFIKYWSGELSWTLSPSESTNPFSGKCTEMQITSFYTATATSKSFLVICPYEGSFTTATSTAGTYQLTIASWKWPDNYGLQAPVGAHLRYLWTGKTGYLTAYLSEAKSGNALPDCLLSDARSVFPLTTSTHKTSIGVTLVSSLTLDPQTASDKEKEKMYILLDINSPTQNDLPIEYCSCGLANIKCKVSKPKSNSQFKFTLYNIDQFNDQTIPKTLLTLTFWISSNSSTDESTTYTGDIYSYFYLNYPLQTSSPTTPIKINTCQTAADWGSSASVEKNVSVQSPSKHCTVAKARTYFEFTFSTNFAVIDYSKFTINLAFFADANSQIQANLRCGVYQKHVVSHLFKKFDTTQLNNVTMEYRLQESTLLKPTSLGSVSYTFRCYGSQMMESAPNTAQIQVINQIDSEIVGQGNGTSQQDNFGSLSTPYSDSSVATITMLRSFDEAGLDSTYTFNIKTTAVIDSETNETSVRFLAGTYLYVEFARDIPPRFNRKGILRCFHEDQPTYCYYESERRIAFLARTDLHHNNSYGHNFSIQGVQRPQTMSKYNTMYFSLVPYDSGFNQMQFQDTSSISDQSPSSINVAMLPVLYYKQNTSTPIRSTYNFYMLLTIPVSQVISTIPIWIDFPEEFDEAMHLGFTPICSLKNLNLTENETIFEFVDDCGMHSTRRLRINITDPVENETEFLTLTKRVYNLTINNIPTYNYKQDYVDIPLIWIGRTDNITVPYYKTNINNFNATKNLAYFDYIDTDKQLLSWENNHIGCYRGTYQCKAKLKITSDTQEYFEYDIDKISSSGIHADKFSFSPSILSASIGKDLEFDIGPKAATIPGEYQLLWNHEVTVNYSKIPPLTIAVLNNKTELSTEQQQYEIPDGGRSLPIIISFKDKMPETEITINGEIDCEDTSCYSFQQSSRTLKYTEDYTQDQLQYIVTGTQSVNSSSQGTISWSLSGTNADSYSVPNEVTLSIVDPPIGNPTLTVVPPDTSEQIGKMSIYAMCTHPGTLYYIVSQDQNKTEIDYTDIKEASEDVFISQTDIGTIYTNPTRSIYGFMSAPAADASNEILFEENLQSEAKYYMRIYCVNLVSAVSDPGDVTWVQESNGGKPLIAKFEFGSNVTNSSNITIFTLSSLKESQRKKICCLICQYTQNEKNRVFGKGAVACEALEDTVKEGEEESSQTESQNDTDNNSTRRFLADTDDDDEEEEQYEEQFIIEPSTFETLEYFVIMPNLFRILADLTATKSILEGHEFRSALEASNILEDLNISSISCSFSNDYPIQPTIEQPILVSSEQQIAFSWAGANNTNGFVFVGVVPSQNASSSPTVTQLKKNSGYGLTGQSQGYYSKNDNITLVVKPLSQCLDYKYFWIATNEDPETYQYQTQIYSGTTTTIGCSFSARLFIFNLLVFIVIFII